MVFRAPRTSSTSAKRCALTDEACCGSRRCRRRNKMPQQEHRRAVRRGCRGRSVASRRDRHTCRDGACTAPRQRTAGRNNLPACGRAPASADRCSHRPRRRRPTERQALAGSVPPAPHGRRRPPSFQQPRARGSQVDRRVDFRLRDLARQVDQDNGSGKSRQAIGRPRLLLAPQKEGLDRADRAFAVALLFQGAGDRIRQVERARPLRREGRHQDEQRQRRSTAAQTSHQLLHDDRQPRSVLSGECHRAAGRQRAHDVDDLDAGLDQPGLAACRRPAPREQRHDALEPDLVDRRRRLAAGVEHRGAARYRVDGRRRAPADKPIAGALDDLDADAAPVRLVADQKLAQQIGKRGRVEQGFDEAAARGDQAADAVGKVVGEILRPQSAFGHLRYPLLQKRSRPMQTIVDCRRRKTEERGDVLVRAFVDIGTGVPARAAKPAASAQPGPTYSGTVDASGTVSASAEIPATNEIMVTFKARVIRKTLSGSIKNSRFAETIIQSGWCNWDVTMTKK
jgi:hypothetical protein